MAATREEMSRFLASLFRSNLLDIEINSVLLLVDEAVRMGEHFNEFVFEFVMKIVAEFLAEFGAVMVVPSVADVFEI